MALEATSTWTALGFEHLEGTVNHVENCHALRVEIARFSNVMSMVAPGQGVSTCPGWTVLDLAEHLGVIHRWAEELVRLRSPVRIPRDIPPSLRDDVNPGWITEGGEQLVATLLAANPDDSMWAWGLDQHVRFWSRRQLHETLVHRMDLELAAGIEPSADSATAVDAVDEYLSNLEKVANHSPDSSLLRGHGERLAFRAGDETPWSITLNTESLSVSRSEGAFDAELVGAPVDLLLAILRRRGLDEAGVEVRGNRQLIDFWLDHSAFD
jgi:uncharacterized protein (TIGR03083 family)